MAGVGGTGVTTAAALLGMAAHIEGRGSGTLDMTGLAQKGGAVVSHVRIADDPEAIARLPQSREARQRIGIEVLASETRLGTGRAAPRALGLDVELRPEPPEDLPVVLAPLDDRPEDSEEGQLRHAEPLGPGRPEASLVENRLPDVEEDRPYHGWARL